MQMNSIITAGLLINTHREADRQSGGAGRAMLLTRIGIGVRIAAPEGKRNRRAGTGNRGDDAGPADAGADLRQEHRQADAREVHAKIDGAEPDHAGVGEYLAERKRLGRFRCGFGKPNERRFPAAPSTESRLRNPPNPLTRAIQALKKPLDGVCGPQPHIDPSL
jgi:hypothetical protein